MTEEDGRATRFVFRPEHRLGGAGAFDRVFKSRRSLRGVRFDLHYCPSPAGGARLGLVVGKRYASLAVDRNRVRRIAREVFRLGFARFGCVDLIFRLKAKVTGVGAEAIRVDLEALLGRVK